MRVCDEQHRDHGRAEETEDGEIEEQKLWKVCVHECVSMYVCVGVFVSACVHVCMLLRLLVCIFACMLVF